LVCLLSVHPVESAVGCAVSVGIVIVEIRRIAVVCPFKPEAVVFTESRQRLLDAEHELITHCDAIKAILAGHMHYDYVSQVTPTLKQYVVNTESCNIVTVR